MTSWDIGTETGLDTALTQFCEGLKQGVCITGMDGIIRYANATLCRILGTSISSLSNQHYRMLYPDNDAVIMELDVVPKAMTSGCESIQTPVRRADGNNHALQVEVRVLQSGSGESLLVHSFFHQSDAQTHRAIEELEAIREAGRSISSSLSLDQVIEAMMCAIVDTLHPDLVLVFLAEGDRLTLRGSEIRTSAVTFQESSPHLVGDCLCGLAVSEGSPVYSRDIRCDTRCTRDECMLSGAHSFAAIPLKAKEKCLGVLGIASLRERDFKASSSFIESLAEEAAIGLQNAILHDRVLANKAKLSSSNSELTSALRELESNSKALARSEELYRTLFEASGEAVFILKDGRIQDCNQHAATLFLQLASDMRGLSCHELFTEYQEGKHVTRESLEALLHQCNRGTPAEASWTCVRGNGERFEAEIKLHPIQLADQTCVQLIIRDISKRKRLEDEVKQYEKMQMAGQLAGGIAHDFNNQLAAIMGFADVISIKAQDPQIESYTELIIDAAKRSSDLTAQLLAFARKGRYQTIPVDLHQCVNEVSRRLSDNDNQVKFAYELKAAPPVIIGDPTQIQSALRNLGRNAIDAMPSGGTLTFSSCSERLSSAEIEGLGLRIDPGPYIHLCIQDNGTGMDELTQKRIFEPFFSTKTQGGGAGLGLAAVYGTIRNHHGAILVHSAPGEGSRFEIYLPAHEEETKTSSDHAEAGEPLQLSILLVEDEPIVQRMASCILEELGHQVAVCQDGLEGLNYYEKHWHEIDLVILDMIMPNMDGYDAFVAMRAINPDIKAILSSGYSIEENAQELLRSGIADFIQKPYQLRDLENRINRLSWERKTSD